MTTMDPGGQPIATASLRAHPYAVTTVAVSRDNLRLVSGDEGGWIVVWDLVIRRPIVVFKPHQRGVIKVGWFNNEVDQVVTHGRDNKLYIWRIEPGVVDYKVTPPLRNSDPEQWLKPWLCHAQDVNALNFCGFASFGTRIAVPATTNSSKIDIYDLESGQLTRPFAAISCNQVEEEKLGILMALVVSADYVIAAWESGHIMAQSFAGSCAQYMAKPHSQPVMSLALVGSDSDSGPTVTVKSAAADSVLATTTLVSLDDGETKVEAFDTRHKGHSCVAIRNDGAIYATTGWDRMVRVYKSDTNKPLAAFNLEGLKSLTFSPIVDNTNNSKNLAQHRIAKTQSRHNLFITSNDRIVIYTLY